ncbi:hypothetical protein [Fusibacter sp. JL216-2]|uniref:hypothetical protein n=1 Tax=Fusibacter sp. JL216-2 TaxID=3071453 RepID=UPI003D351217
MRSLNKSINLQDIERMDERLSEELEARVEFKGATRACGLDLSLGICPVWACAINLIL